MMEFGVKRFESLILKIADMATIRIVRFIRK
jgi:hypothetical protein